MAKLHHQFSSLNKELNSLIQTLEPYQFIFTGSKQKPKQAIEKIIVKLNDKRTKLCLIVLDQAENEIDVDSDYMNSEIYEHIRNKLMNTRTTITEYDENFVSAQKQILNFLIREKILKNKNGFLSCFSKFIEELPDISKKFMESCKKLRQIEFDDWDIDETDENDPRSKLLEDIHKEMLESFGEYMEQGEQYVKSKEEILRSSSTEQQAADTQEGNDSAIFSDEEGNLLTVVPIPKDSDCFYSAIADQLNRLNIKKENNESEEESNFYTSKHLKEVTLDFINANREDKYGIRLTNQLQDQDNLPENIKSVEEYIAYHRKEDAWVDSNIIDALAHALKIAIKIYTNEGHPSEYNLEEKESVTVKLLVNEKHYDSLVTRLPFEQLPFECSYPKESNSVKRIFEILNKLERGERLDHALELIGTRLKLSSSSIIKLKGYLNAADNQQKLFKTVALDDDGHWYNDEDMNSYGKTLQKYGVNFETQFSNRITHDLVKTLPPLTENEVRYICYNIGGSSHKDNSGIHWVGLVLVKQQQTITILYKDSKGDFNNSSENIVNLFREHYHENIEFIRHEEAEQLDVASCGPMTINNLEIMAKTIKEANDAGNNGITKLINTFNTIQFTTQQEVCSIRMQHSLQNISKRKFMDDKNIDDIENITKKLKLISHMDVNDEKEKCTDNSIDKENILDYVCMIDESYEKIREWDGTQVKAWSKEHKGKLSKQSIQEICEAIAVMDRANELATGGHRLRDTQKVATIIFMQTSHQGHISQINTGEGKTTIVSLVQALKIFQGYKGHVITSNNILAADGVKDKQLFYQLLDITVAHNNPNEKYKDGPRACYSKDVVYGSISNFQFDWLRHSFEQLKTLGDTDFNNTWVILDEIDSLLIDQGGNIAKLSGPFPGMEGLRYVYINIWVELAKAEDDVTQELLQARENKSKEILERQSACQDGSENEAEIEWKNQHEFENFEDELRESFLDKIKEKIKAKKNKFINKNLLASHLHQYAEDSVDRWIEFGFSAKYQYNENVEYKIAKGKDGEYIIIPVDNQNTGVSMQNTILSNGLHQFLQIKHNLCLTYESLTSCYVSNLDYIKKYSTKLSGVTGTLGSDAEMGLLSGVFNLGYSIMPPFKPKQFISFPGKMVEDDNFINSVAVAALSELGRTTLLVVEGEQEAEDRLVDVIVPRAVLLICASILEVNMLAKEIEEEAKAAGLNPKIRVYIDEAQAHVTEEILGVNEIVIATNLAGRGTDFKTTKELEQNGGLHVIEAFLPCNKRVENQGLGRTARQGNAGTGQIIAKMSEIKELGIVMRGDDFNEVLKQRDELEVLRIKNIKENKIMELEFMGKLFEKFSFQYAALKNEHKSGTDVIKWIYVLKDLKEKWAFWLERQAYTAEKIKTLGDSKSDVVNGEYNKFLKEADNIIKGCIKHNPFYSICLAERYLDVGVDKENKDKAREALANAINISESSELLYSAHIKLFELAIEDGQQVLKRYKKALARIYFMNVEADVPGYKEKAKDSLEKAQKALALEYDYIDELIYGRKIDADNNDKRENSILQSIIVSNSEMETDNNSENIDSNADKITSNPNTEKEKETVDHSFSNYLLTHTFGKYLPSSLASFYPQKSNVTENETYFAEQSDDKCNLFMKHLQARYFTLATYKGNIDSLIKQLNGENVFEKPEEALTYTDGAIIGVKVPRYLLKLDSKNELKKVINKRAVDEIEYCGMSSVYQLQKIHDVPPTIIRSAQWQIGGALSLYASAIAFPILLPVNGPLAGAMLSEGITDIVMALINQGYTAFNKSDYIKGKVISYGISLVTMGITALLKSTKVLTKAMNACRRLADKLRAVKGPFENVCKWIAGHLDKIVLYLEHAIEKIEFMKKTAEQQTKYLSKLKDSGKVEQFQQLQKFLKTSDVAVHPFKIVTQMLTSSALGAVQGIAISVCMEKIFIASLNRSMSGLQPIINCAVKDTIQKRICLLNARGYLNLLSLHEIHDAVNKLFETDLGEDIGQVAKEIALGVLRHSNDWKMLAFETILAGYDIATFTNKICDKFDEQIKYLITLTSSDSKIDHSTKDINGIIIKISEPVAGILYSKIVSITGKVLYTLPKILYRGYKERQEKEADTKAVNDIRVKLNMIDAADNEAQQANSRCVHDAVADTLGLDNSKQLADATNLGASNKGASVEDAVKLFTQNGIEVTSCGTEDAQNHFKQQDSDRGVVCLSGDQVHGHAVPVTLDDNVLMVTPKGRDKMPLEQYQKELGFTNATVLIPKAVNESTIQGVQQKCNFNRIVRATHQIDYVGQDGGIKYGRGFSYCYDSVDSDDIGKMTGYAKTRVVFNAVEGSQISAKAAQAHSIYCHVGKVKDKSSFLNKQELCDKYDEALKSDKQHITNSETTKGVRQIIIARVKKFDGFDNQQHQSFKYITIVRDKPAGRDRFLPQTVFPSKGPKTE